MAVFSVVKMHNQLKSLTACLQVLLISFIVAGQNAVAEDLEVLVVTGGHKYDEEEFKEMVESMEGINPHWMDKEEMRKMSAKEIDGKFDAMLLMDQTKAEVGEEITQQYLDLIEEGTGMVFLHFTLASFPLWDGFPDIIGGKYHLGRFDKVNKPSKYHPEITVEIEVVVKDHPATEGLTDFTMTDAFYDKISIVESAKPLLGSKTEGVMKTVAWENKAGNSKVIYFMPGYTKSAYTNPSYKQFVLNALNHVAK